MKLPTSIHVHPHDFKVLEVSSEEALTLGYHGLFSDTEGVIRIRTDLRDSVKINVLIHECLHAIWSTHHLDEKEEEEHVVSVFGTAVYSLFKDNPQLKKLV